MAAESTNPLTDYSERFHECAASGDVSKLYVFLQGSLDINITNGKGWTALMFAARNGHVEVVKALLNKGCDVSVINGSGQTALDIAHFWSHAEVVSILSKSEPCEPGYISMPNQAMSHYFCHNILDRSAHRRKDAAWLENAMQLKTTVFVLFTNLNPYVIQQPDYTEGKVSSGYKLLQLRCSDISTYLNTKPLLVFLGEETVIPSGDKVAWFAVDSGGISEEEIHKIQPHAELMSQFYSALQLDKLNAGIVSQARPIFAWHERYAFCPTCGSKAIAEEGGYKRTCTNAECESLKGIHNTSYPRVDPTVIMAVVSPDNKSLLLGRGARHPRGMFSCLAGFMEPGESIEDACRREVHEEAGVSVGRVDYHSCQSWPAPTSLMIGCIAYATDEKIKIDKEELESARWFTRRELVQLLTRQHPEGLYCPPPMAIAHHLIKTWVNMTSNL